MNAPRPVTRRQRGMATLIVVMVLFFVVSLVAAYTNRNLVFEQRTSANNLRATQGLESAQAGLEWAVALLNTGRITNACAPSANGADPSFRERYVGIDAATGFLTPLNKTAGGVRSAACSFTGAAWICDCPTDADPLPPMPLGITARQSYRVWFTSLPSPRPNLLRVDVLACPTWDNACLTIGNVAGAEGRSQVSALVTLYPALRMMPSSALTARGQADGTAATVSAYNDNVEVGGVAVVAGGAVNGITTSGIAGAPQSMSVLAGDPSLQVGQALPVIDTAENHMFARTFGVLPTDYRQQSGLVALGGCPCDATALRNTIALNPGRPIWVTGSLTLDGTIGSPAAPVMVVVTGDVTASAATTFHGALYVRNPVVPPATSGIWGMSGSADFQGAAIAESDFVASGAGTVNFLYDQTVLRTLQRTTGTWVVLPSSWKDYQ